MTVKTASQSLLDTEDSCNVSTDMASFEHAASPRCQDKRRTRICKYKKGNWTADEDELLLRWVNQQGACKWTQCSKTIKGRCGKQCRERWVNILNPGVKKGKWSQQEQTAIFDNLCSHLTAWSTIAKILPGRTENSIKNYFYSSIRRIQANPIVNLVREKLSRGFFYSPSETRKKLEKHSTDLNVLSQLICEYILIPQNIGQFYALLCSQFTEETGQNANGSREGEDSGSFLLYPALEIPEMLCVPCVTHTPETYSSADSEIFVQPKCWNCLSSSCDRHLMEISGI